MAAPSLAGLNCPNCGAAITIRALQQTQTVVCAACHAVLDAKDQQLSVLQAYQAQMTFSPDIPLGTRGTLRGDAYEVSGFQVRSVRHNEVEYFWREYTLWNPYKGYRYLMEYNGHWCDFAASRIAPSEMVSGRQPYVTYQGELFRHFRTTTVTTVFILGEFPWQIRSGDRVTSRDFVAPPRMLSEEVSPDATGWWVGAYLPAAVVWRAFALPGAAPQATGIFPCEPNTDAPRARAGRVRALWLAVPVAAALLARALFAAPNTVLGQRWPYLVLLALLALFAVPAIVDGMRASAFERARWSDSDYAADNTD